MRVCACTTRALPLCAAALPSLVLQGDFLRESPEEKLAKKAANTASAHLPTVSVAPTAGAWVTTSIGGLAAFFCHAAKKRRNRQRATPTPVSATQMLAAREVNQGATPRSSQTQALLRERQPPTAPPSVPPSIPDVVEQRQLLDHREPLLRGLQRILRHRVLADDLCKIRLREIGETTLRLQRTRLRDGL
jgi:hypothetical protein